MVNVQRIPVPGLIISLAMGLRASVTRLGQTLQHFFQRHRLLALDPGRLLMDPRFPFAREPPFPLLHNGRLLFLLTEVPFLSKPPCLLSTSIRNPLKPPSLWFPHQIIFPCSPPLRYRTGSFLGDHVESFRHDAEFFRHAPIRNGVIDLGGSKVRFLKSCRICST